MECIIEAIRAGTVRAMPNDGRPTGMFKTPVDGVVEIGIDGIRCDAQADRRVHGGPHKAIHQYPSVHYAQLAQQFDEVADALVVGAMGENLSAAWGEAEVCIGDVFSFGTARLQLSQPRSPCWKIDARYGVDGMTRYVAQHGIAGWYYRVLQPGHAQAGDVLRLIERNREPVNLREYWNLSAAPRPPLEMLLRVIATPGLAPDKCARWQQRLNWLRANDAGYQR